MFEDENVRYIIAMHSDLAMDKGFIRKLGKFDVYTETSAGMKKGYHLTNDRYIIQIDNRLTEPK
jgi:hypothetical protein